MTCTNLGNMIVCTNPIGRLHVGNRYVWVDYHTHCGPSFSYDANGENHTTQWTKTTLFGPHLEHGWQV